jgi:hypothetical protein
VNPSILRAPLDVVARRGSIELEAHEGGVFPNNYQPIWLGVGQRLQQHGLHGAENGGIGPNSQGQRSDRNGKEARIFSHLAEGVLEMSEEVRH